MVEFDAARQDRLAHHYLIDSTASRRLASTVSLAAGALDFPHAQINILDETVQYTIADYRAGGMHSMPRLESMCHFTLGVELLAVDDLQLDDRFAALPGVQAGLARSYLGAALRSREGVVVGTLCVFDTEPRGITPEQMERISQFAAIVEDQLDVMRRAKDLRLSEQPGLADLVDAIARGEIVAWYQPIVDLSTDRVVAFEALARWERADGAIEQPANFVPLAEDSDLILDLDAAVLGSAVKNLAKWRRGRPELRLAVNLSTRHLELPTGVAAIHHAVVTAGVPPSSIDIELTETRALSSGDRARAAVAELRELGYGVMLDDFGSGWSSLDWILGLPITGIKVDGAVTAALGTATGDAVTQAVRNLTNDLALDVVIEGIATRAQADRARALGYRSAQGYHWARPMSAADAAVWTL